jgi:hypothetical protein
VRPVAVAFVAPELGAETVIGEPPPTGVATIEAIAGSEVVHSIPTEVVVIEFALIPVGAGYDDHDTAEEVPPPDFTVIVQS